DVSAVALPSPGSVPIHHSPPATPDSESVDVAVIVLVWSVGRVAGSTVTVGAAGAVRSTLTVADTVVLRPALSTAVPDSTRAAPSFWPVDCAGGHVATPATASLHVNVAVTAELRHPAAFDAGDNDAVICGGVVSTFSVTVAVPPPEPVTFTTWDPLARPPGVNAPRYGRGGAPSIDTSNDSSGAPL